MMDIEAAIRALEAEVVGIPKERVSCSVASPHAAADTMRFEHGIDPADHGTCMLLQTAKEEERESAATQKADDCSATPIVTDEGAAEHVAAEHVCFCSQIAASSASTRSST